MPINEADRRFEEILQDLPEQILAKAIEFKAFVRAREIKTPQQLLRAVLLYCGLDHSTRLVAAEMTALDEPITEQSISERLTACGPWLKAVLPTMLPPAGVPQIASNKRLRVIDASEVTSPGVKTSQYRIHVKMDLVSLEFITVLLTDYRVGESLKHFPLDEHEVGIA